MRIHTVKPGDTLWTIGREYSTPPSKIAETNELLNPERPCTGQRLMIFTPTRTYTARGGDTLEELALRFSTDTESLLAHNPELGGKAKIYPGQVLSLKFDAPRYGSGLANGYFYQGTPKERLELALPYLSYLTFGSHKWSGAMLSELFSLRTLAREVRERGVLPIIRIYLCEPLRSHELGKFTESVKRALSTSGAAGISLSAGQIKSEELSDILFAIKRELMQDGLLLHAELDGNNQSGNWCEISEIADTVILSYSKGHEKEIPSFECGEEKLITEYANLAECHKTLLELPVFAYENGEEIELPEAIKNASRLGTQIEYDEMSRMCHYSYNKYTRGKGEATRVSFEAPENTKAKLDLIGELGYMGVSFDIMRAPRELLMLFHTSFHTPR